MTTPQDFIAAAAELGFEAAYDEEANTITATRVVDGESRGSVSFHFAERPAASEDDRLQQWERSMLRLVRLDGLTFEQAWPLLERELAEH